MVLYVYLKKFAYILLFTLWWAEAGGIGPWRGWLTIVLQCYDTVGWVIWPVKSSQKWPIMCRVVKPYCTILPSVVTLSRPTTTAHSDMHHPVCGIKSRILSVSLASHVSTHLLIHLSAYLYYHHHSYHPSILHSFTPGSKPTFSTNPSHLRFLLPTGLPSWQRDYHAHRFIFSFTF